MNQSAMPVAERLASTQMDAAWRLLSARHLASAPPPVASHLLIEALPAGVIMLDGAGRVSECNAIARELLGEPLTGMLWREVIARAFAPLDGVDGLRLTSGRVVTVATAPLGDEPGQVILLNDVTGTRVMQAIVQRRQRLSSLGEMIASLSHQIRTPLASSLLYLSQLERDDISAAARDRCIAKIRGCLGHLGNLTRDMLTFAGGGVLQAENFRIADLLADFRELSASLLDGSRCRLEIIDDSDGSALRGNRDAVMTVLQSLVQNAVQACESTSAKASAGNLRLLIRRVDERTGIASIEILLTDDGPGIPDEARTHVLEPFFSTKPGGTGLGLAMARAVVQAHSGDIWIDSTAGDGTTVGLRFPIAGNAASDRSDG